jgi:SAM-dependent methyltransferase
VGHVQGRTILHFAPGPAERIEPLASQYVTADIELGKADHEVNIEAIAFARSSFFDVIISSHVLQQVDERKALGEFFRVLRAGGLLLLMSPVVWTWGKTYEDPNITSARDRRSTSGRAIMSAILGPILSVGASMPDFASRLVPSTEPAISRHGLHRGGRPLCVQERLAWWRGKLPIIDLILDISISQPESFALTVRGMRERISWWPAQTLCCAK